MAGRDSFKFVFSVSLADYLNKENYISMQFLYERFIFLRNLSSNPRIATGLIL